MHQSAVGNWVHSAVMGMPVVVQHLPAGIPVVLQPLLLGIPVVVLLEGTVQVDILVEVEHLPPEDILAGPVGMLPDEVSFHNPGGWLQEVSLTSDQFV